MAFDPETRTCLSFDDVLLVPGYSKIETRKDVCLQICVWVGELIVVG